jgi:hypothetical protein
MPAKTDSAIYNAEFNYFVALCPFCRVRNVIIMPGSEFEGCTCKHFRRLDEVKEEAVF